MASPLILAGEAVLVQNLLEQLPLNCKMQAQPHSLVLVHLVLLGILP